MIAVSSTIKTDCNSDSLNYKEYIVIDSTIVEIKGKMSNSCYNEGNIFGTFIFKKLEFTTENDINYKKKEFEYYKSINGNAFKIGTYIVTDINDNDSSETVKVTSYDYGLKFAIPYVSTLDYEGGEVTLYDVLSEACTNASVSLANTTITNGDFIIDSNQFVNGELIGDVIKAVTQMSGDFATINEDDELELIYEEDTTEIIEDYEDLDDKRDTHPITSVSIGNSQVSGQEAILRDLDLIALYGEHWLILNDNPFSYTLEKRQELVTDIFNKVKGFSYSSFDSKYAFKPYLQLGDKIQFKNKSGVLVNSRIFKIDTDYDNIKLSAPSIIDASVDYTKSPNAEELAKRAEIIANQANASIIITAEKADGNSSNIADLTIESNQISTTVSSFDSSINGEEENDINLITLSDGSTTVNGLTITTENNTITINGISTQDTYYNLNQSVFFNVLKYFVDGLLGNLKLVIKNSDEEEIYNGGNGYFEIAEELESFESEDIKLFIPTGANFNNEELNLTLAEVVRDGGILENLNTIKEAVETINSTMMTQTSTAFEMLFTQTGIEGTVEALSSLLNTNTTDLNRINQYIRFEGGVISLGASDSQSKLILNKDRISFMTGENESAYITENQLYITDATILRKLQIEKWLIEPDFYGNLNTKWRGDN